jgi:hypothetical protein
MRDDEFLTKPQGSIESHHQQQQSLFENSRILPDKTSRRDGRKIEIFCSYSITFQFGCIFDYEDDED